MEDNVTKAPKSYGAPRLPQNYPKVSSPPANTKHTLMDVYMGWEPWARGGGTILYNPK